MSDVTLWKNNTDIVIPPSQEMREVVDLARQLRPVDQKQIITAFNSGNYQMLSTYVWSKTVSAIRNQLNNMGAVFVGEMLDRPDINEATNLQNAITDFESIQLAEDLGLISGKSAFRLKQAMELLSYFNNPDLDDVEEGDFSKIDAMQVVVTCIQGVLGHDRIELRIDFKQFRQALEDEVLTSESVYIIKLLQSPIFFKRATLRILLSIVKSANGAQLENAISNSNLIIPAIWGDIKKPERWQVGRCYAELFTEGKSTAVSGLKQVLLKVKGFDYVPEDLRSTSFVKAANDIIKAHEGLNNYYHEALPTRILKEMGSIIPMPAFAICMSAVICIKLGNRYGFAWDAQNSADIILLNNTEDKWLYYFDECLPNDNRVLYKLTQRSPRERWIDMIKAIQNIERISEQVKNVSLKQLLKATLISNQSRIETLAIEIQSSANSKGYEN